MNGYKDHQKFSLYFAQLTNFKIHLFTFCNHISFEKAIKNVCTLHRSAFYSFSLPPYLKSVTPKFFILKYSKCSLAQFKKVCKQKKNK